jgi:glycine betaine/proline transport system substrate-binding protein
MFPQRTTYERGEAAASGGAWPRLNTRQAAKLLVGGISVGLALTGCAARSNGTAAQTAGVDHSVSAALKKEGPIEFLDHSYASSTVQAELLSQVLNAMGGDTKVVSMGDIAAAFPAVAKQVNMFDPEQWRMLEEPLFQKYVDKGQSVVSFAKSLLSGEEGWYVPTYVIRGDAARGIKPTCPGLPDYHALNGCAKEFATARTGDKGQFMSISKAYEPAYGDYARIKNLNLNYQVEFAGSTSALDAEWKRAYEKGEPFLALMWKPTYTGLKYDLTRVEFLPYTPQCWGTTYACNWGAVGIQSLANPKFEATYPTAAKIIKNYDLNDRQMLDLLTRIQEDGLDPKDAVAQWIKDNPKVWQAWAP